MIEMFRSLSKDIENLKDIYNLAVEESDEEIFSDCLIKIDETNIKISEICTYEHKDFPSYYKYLKGLDNDGRFMVLSSMIDK